LQTRPDQPSLGPHAIDALLRQQFRTSIATCTSSGPRSAFRDALPADTAARRTGQLSLIHPGKLVSE
jgi:hypothetical protein